MIGVIDYGVANLGSMRNMLRRIGVEPEFVSTADAIERADKLILPGIGAFEQGMKALTERGLVEPLRSRVREGGIPILGVCLGMQLLGESSCEGTGRGLGLIAARSEKLREDPSAGVRVPHMGWNHLRPLNSSRLLDGLDAGARFYFVHSYHVVCADRNDVLATTQHGAEIVAMIQRDNIYGAQFHPEKSHRFGMRLLQNFVEL